MKNTNIEKNQELEIIEQLDGKYARKRMEAILSSKQSLLLERVGEKREEAGTYDVLCDNETCTAVTAHNKAFDDITKIINEIFNQK